jgi:hypothetical protein
MGFMGGGFEQFLKAVALAEELLNGKHAPEVLQKKLSRARKIRFAAPHHVRAAAMPPSGPFRRRPVKTLLQKGTQNAQIKIRTTRSPPPKKTF